MKMKNRARACLLLPLLTLLGCLCAGHARAQSVPVTLHATDTALEQVLDQIERQTTYLFVYDQSVDVARKVSVEATARLRRSPRHAAEKRIAATFPHDQYRL